MNEYIYVYIYVCTYIYTDIHMFFQDVMDDGLDMWAAAGIYVYACIYL
jgi:hypothetical protein